MGAGRHRTIRTQEKVVTGWHHAPPPGSRSGVADYAQRLGNALQPHWDPSTDLYHIGNNGLHLEIYTRAIERPGIVVLHDAVLNHLLLGTLDRERYVAEFVHNYGEWRRDLAEELWERRASSGVDPRYFEFVLPVSTGPARLQRFPISSNSMGCRMPVTRPDFDNGWELHHPRCSLRVLAI